MENLIAKWEEIKCMQKIALWEKHLRYFQMLIDTTRIKFLCNWTFFLAAWQKNTSQGFWSYLQKSINTIKFQHQEYSSQKHQITAEILPDSSTVGGTEGFSGLNQKDAKRTTFLILFSNILKIGTFFKEEFHDLKL